jgi:tetratricopeptide (TPR) repeat protein
MTPSFGEGHLVATLYGTPAAARLRLSNRTNPKRILAVAEYGYSLRLSEPLLGVQWCRVAADVATDALDPRIQGRVLGYFGNSLRVVGNYDDARDAIERGLKISPNDPLLLEFKGSLLRDICQFDEAAACIQSALMRRKVDGDVAGYARTILLTAQVMNEAGQSREAATFCLKALDLLDVSVDPTRHLLRTTIQNYASFLCDADKALAALQALQALEPLLEGGGPFFELRVEWLRGKIAAKLCDESAESQLTSVRKKLEEGGLLQEAAHATLDLAKYFARQKDSRAASVALSVAPIFQSLGIERDAREAVLLSQIAAADAEGSDIEELINELHAVVASRPSARQVA